jgi:hypothetical protein
METQCSFVMCRNWISKYNKEELEASRGHVLMLVRPSTCFISILYIEPVTLRESTYTEKGHFTLLELREVANSPVSPTNFIHMTEILVIRGRHGIADKEARAISRWHEHWNYCNIEASSSTGGATNWKVITSSSRHPTHLQPQYVSRYSYGLQTGQVGFDSRQGQDISLLHNVQTGSGTHSAY